MWTTFQGWGTYTSPENEKPKEYCRCPQSFTLSDHHDWVNTGFKWTFCRRCNVEGVWHFGNAKEGNGR